MLSRVFYECSLEEKQGFNWSWIIGIMLIVLRGVIIIIAARELYDQNDLIDPEL